MDERVAAVCNELAVSLLLIWLILKTGTGFATFARCHLQSEFGASRWQQDRITFYQAVIEYNCQLDAIQSTCHNGAMNCDNCVLSEIHNNNVTFM